jgi:hypothetical protein
MKLRIDTSAVSFICTRSPEQRIAFDTGQPKVDRETGQPLWQVQLMALDASGADVIAVTVPVIRTSPSGSRHTSKDWWRCHGAKRGAAVWRSGRIRSAPPAQRSRESSRHRKRRRRRGRQAARVSPPPKSS